MLVSEVWRCLLRARRLRGPFRVSLGIAENPSPFADLKITWLSVSQLLPASLPWALLDFPSRGQPTAQAPYGLALQVKESRACAGVVAEPVGLLSRPGEVAAVRAQGPAARDKGGVGAHGSVCACVYLLPHS